MFLSTQHRRRDDEKRFFFITVCLEGIRKMTQSQSKTSVSIPFFIVREEFGV